MSGLVVGYGSPDPLKMEEMFKKINYRGPYVSGISTNKQVMMAQNYLKADCPLSPALEMRFGKFVTMARWEITKN
jgi:hypothetical protein